LVGKTVEIISLTLLNRCAPADLDEQRAEWRQSLWRVDPSTLGVAPTAAQIREANAALMAERSVRKVRCVPSADAAISCYCGNDRNIGEHPCVQCAVCSSYQHVSCVGYNAAVEVGPYLCPECAARSPPLPSAATLVISPAALAEQWIEEVQRHTAPNSFRILHYKGVSNLRSAADRPASSRARSSSSSSSASSFTTGTVLPHNAHVRPSILAGYDIVVTTYETLRSDLSHMSTGVRKRSRRHAARYPSMPTPLSHVAWWRVCLDEAQLVKSLISGIGILCGELFTHNRWLVTGTPIQRSLGDLSFCIDFLMVGGFSRNLANTHLQQWYAGGQSPHGDQLLRYLRQVMWRTRKEDVAAELHLQEVREVVTYVPFSRVEALFYRQLKQDCVQRASAHLEHAHGSVAISNRVLLPGAHSGAKAKRKRSAKGKEPEDEEALAQGVGLSRVLQLLRQACCHPQVVRHSVNRTNMRAMRHGPMTAVEMLAAMCDRARSACEEALRQFAFSGNGLAGVLLLQRNMAEAAAVYRHCLEVANTNREHFAIDVLQR
jgi:E3 ubiquitin-protein ligase SHPRH